MKLPRLKLVHVMLIVGGLAIVFGILSSRPGESSIGIVVLGALALVWFVFTILRPNPLKGVLANLPDDPDQSIAALEDGLARANPHDRRTIFEARQRLMDLYKGRKRYDDAVDQGRSILRLNGLAQERENEVRTEMAICLDFLGKADLAELERMAVTDGSDDTALS